MNFEDKGFLINKSRYNENSVIAEFFTKSHGKCSGIIFGATSKKLKNYLLVGNKFHISYNAKSEVVPWYIGVEAGIPRGAYSAPSQKVIRFGYYW